MSITQHQLFGNIDLKKIKDDKNFKEDSVRETIILPILTNLGYEQENIIRSKILKHPFLKIGSNKKIPVTLIPDYILKVENNYAWVLDAKAPNEKLINDEHVGQVYSYAMHSEIRSTYFALCNGIEFSLFRTSNPNESILFFEISEIESNWDKLSLYLSPNSFQTGKNITYTVELQHESAENINDWYRNRPLLNEIPVRKRQAKRHFGVHGYFTRQSWNVVNEYIKNFTRPNDLVLDPFGGSGVTIVEALMNNRRGINLDINPMAIFLVQSLMVPVEQNELKEAFEQVKNKYLKNEPKTKAEINRAIKNYPQPKPLPLPKSSDVETVDKLFSDKQLAQLSYLKSIIMEQPKENIRDSLLLMFSGLVTKINLTYHTSTYGGGNAGVFVYYRYRIARTPLGLDIMHYFELRCKKILEAKKEMEYFINNNTISNAQIIKGSATNLKILSNESVDYIYTDPPYGRKIPYLDLSTMWNAWLDLEVTEEDYQQEAIEGGEHNKSKGEYKKLIKQSIKEMYRVLKFDRWLSFVFAHKDPEFWHLIIDTAESCGFEYVGAVSQKNGQTSFKKRQNPFTVLSGQLIINFRKTRNPRAIMKANLGMDITDIVMQTIEGIIAKHNGTTLEQINDELIIKGLELGFLDLLKKQYSDLTQILKIKFDYDDDTELYTIKKNTKFTSRIPIELRIQYYLISYLRRMERENKTATFDEIILEILPLLQNGVTPEDQTILSVLEKIADRVGDAGWRIKPKSATLFDSVI